jgi:hypothetical protein
MHETQRNFRCLVLDPQTIITHIEYHFETATVVIERLATVQKIPRNFHCLVLFGLIIIQTSSYNILNHLSTIETVSKINRTIALFGNLVR